MPLFYSEPVHIVRGEGIWLHDASGRRYMDLYNNVSCVGHANPRIAAAMQTQAGTLNVHSRYLHEAILEYAERLIDLHAEPLTRAVFCCTGTKASEIALLMARTATGGRGIICTDACYHGNSTEVRRLANAGRDPAGNPEIRAIPYPQINTFASSPLQAAVGMAVLDELEERGLLDNVVAAGGHLRTGLDQLQTEYECMGDVRGHGLALGVDWVRDRETKAPDRDGVRAVVNGLKDRGFLAGSAGSLGNVLKLRPPLVFSKDNADAFLDALSETLGKLHG